MTVPKALGSLVMAAAFLAPTAVAQQAPGGPVLAPDCNGNGVADVLDIATGHSQDCQQDGIPDECQLEAPYRYQYDDGEMNGSCLLYTSPSPRDLSTSRMPSSA